MWTEGYIGRYRYEAKVFIEPSKYGIDGGRISKLAVMDSRGNAYCTYDRGWVIEPDNDEIKAVVHQIIELYN